jgi:hypothetical protein
MPRNFWTGLVVGVTAPATVRTVIELRRRRREREKIAEWGEFQAAAARSFARVDYDEPRTNDFFHGRKR